LVIVVATSSFEAAAIRVCRRRLAAPWVPAVDT